MQPKPTLRPLTHAPTIAIHIPKRSPKRLELAEYQKAPLAEREHRIRSTHTHPLFRVSGRTLLGRVLRRGKRAFFELQGNELESKGRQFPNQKRRVRCKFCYGLSLPSTLSISFLVKTWPLRRVLTVRVECTPFFSLHSSFSNNKVFCSAAWLTCFAFLTSSAGRSLYYL